MNNLQFGTGFPSKNRKGFQPVGTRLFFRAPTRPKTGKEEQHVTAAMTREVFARYVYSGYDAPSRVLHAHGRTCEIDHLISRELGGADVVDNPWPQAYGSPWITKTRDKLEDRLNREMFGGAITLKQARDRLREERREAYKLYYGQPSELSPRKSPCGWTDYQ